MLKIITGIDTNSTALTLAKAVKESIAAGRQTYIFIPDQFSLVYDRRLYDVLGAKDFNRISIFGPDRFCKKLIEEYGSSGKYCDDNTRLIVMYKACKEFEASGGARYYKRSLDKGSFFGSICDTIDEIRQSSVGVHQLAAAAETLSGTVSDKLYDISSICTLYNQQLDKYGLKDTSTAVVEASEIIKEHRLFDGCDVYIDSFSSFSADQLGMLKEIFSQASNITAALTIGNGRNAKSAISPFAVSLKTKSALEKLAGDTGHTIKVVSADNQARQRRSVKVLADNIFAPVSTPVCSGEGVSVVYSNDEYSQAEYVFAEISRLVKNGDCRYGEIAIISRSLEESSGLLEDMAYRYEVPLFCDLRKNVSQSSPVLFINAVFDCIASKKFRTKSILSYIKSPLSYIDIWECALIEDYVYKWSVDGEMWLEDFTACDDASNERCVSELTKINTIRQKIIEPLIRLKKSCEGSNCSDISAALMSFMREVKMNDKTFSEFSITSAQEKTTLEINRIYKQLWQLFISAIETIHSTLSQEPITLKEYYELLKTMLSQLTVSSPPQKLDAVIAASAEHSRLSDMKVVFIIGVNDGVFPKNARMSSLFTDREKATLEQENIHLEKRLETNIQGERFVCFQAICAASDRLYLCIPAADRKGDALHPSPIASQIKNMFTDDISVYSSKLPTEFFCQSKKAALFKYSELYKTSPDRANAIKAALDKYSDYGSLIDFTQELALGKEHSIAPDTAEKIFLGSGMDVSATRTKTFYQCPFMYFCRYGLKIKPSEKISIDSLSIGNITHKCLELIMSDGKGYRSDFTSLSEEQIRQLVSECTDNYIKEAMGGSFGKTASFNAMCDLLKERVVQTVIDVQAELKGTDFTPVAFEFSLTDENNAPLMQFASSGGVKISINGSVDRVDILELNGECYIRIIDYKTGDTAIDYADIYNGINQQMLIYLLAITSTANALNPDKKLKPAGVIYLKAGEIKTDKLAGKAELLQSIKSGSLDAMILKKQESAFSRNGIVVDNLDVIQNMVNAGSRFSPVKLKSKYKDGEPPYYQKDMKYVLKDDAFNKLQQYAYESIITMADKLSQGEIPAMPKVKGTSSPCDYCDYSAVCGKAFREDSIKITKADAVALFTEIGADVSLVSSENREEGDSNE